MMIPEMLLAAMIMVESSGRDDVFGDNGQAAGCLQIHACVVEDVNRVYGTQYRWPDDCLNRDRATAICRLYLRHYAGANASMERLVRIWNGGPRGHHKKSTKQYWRRVQAKMSIKRASKWPKLKGAR